MFSFLPHALCMLLYGGWRRGRIRMDCVCECGACCWFGCLVKVNRKQFMRWEQSYLSVNDLLLLHTMQQSWLMYAIRRQRILLWHCVNNLFFFAASVLSQLLRGKRGNFIDDILTSSIFLLDKRGPLFQWRHKRINNTSTPSFHCVNAERRSEREQLTLVIDNGARYCLILFLSTLCSLSLQWNGFIYRCAFLTQNNVLQLTVLV